MKITNRSHKIIKSSTLTFLEESRRTPDHNLIDILHGYVYARWPYLYIGIGTGEHVLARIYQRITNAVKGFLGLKGNDLNSGKKDVENTIAAGYHGKVMPLENARRLVIVQEEIRIPDLEQVIPYPKARSLILHNPDHIVALECPCRASRPNPCLPLDVCLIVGEPFASMVVDQHPQRARWISQQEAVDILYAEDQRGHVHHAFFKDAMLGRFYAICNCCECCCGAMQAHRNGTPMLASSGYVAQVDADECLGCGECEGLCPFGAMSISNGYASVELSLCMGCGICVSHCPQDAISLARDETKSPPLEINAPLCSPLEVSKPG